MVHRLLTPSFFKLIFIHRSDALLADKDRSQPLATVNDFEQRRRVLFTNPPGPAGCLVCAGRHAPPSLSRNADPLSRGLDADETVFKSASLKSVDALMHGGRFSIALSKSLGGPGRVVSRVQKNLMRNSDKTEQKRFLKKYGIEMFVFPDLF